MYQMDLEMLFHFALALEMDVIPFWEKEQPETLCITRKARLQENIHERREMGCHNSVTSQREVKQRVH